MNFEVVSGISSVLGAVLAVIMLFNPDTTIQKIMAAIICGCFTIIILGATFRYSKAKRYLIGEKKMRTLRNELQMIKSPDKLTPTLHAALLIMTEVCNSISDIFQTVRKNRDIRVCIKYINADANTKDLYVKTLCKDVNYDRNKTTMPDLLDRLLDNSDFRHILQCKENGQTYETLYFYGSWLSLSFQYTNSHIPRDYPSGISSLYKRIKAWPLPYKSTIVVPILSGNKTDINAFLCIDSQKNVGFDKTRDIEILKDISLTLSGHMDVICNNYLKA